MNIRRLLWSTFMTRPDEPWFAPHGRKLVYMGVADVLAERIGNGIYPPEGRLPSEMDLVAEFGCSRESVRRAVEELRNRGLIETVKGKGSYILPPGERGPSQN